MVQLDLDLDPEGCAPSPWDCVAGVNGRTDKHPATSLLSPAARREDSRGAGRGGGTSTLPKEPRRDLCPLDGTAAGSKSDKRELGNAQMP